MPNDKGKYMAELLYWLRWRWIDVQFMVGRIVCLFTDHEWEEIINDGTFKYSWFCARCMKFKE